MLVVPLWACGGGAEPAPAHAIPPGTYHLVAVGPLSPPVFVRRVQYLGPVGTPETWRWSLTGMRLRVDAGETVAVERDFQRVNETTGARVDSTAATSMRAEGLRLCAGGCRSVTLRGDTLRVPFESVPPLGGGEPAYAFVRR